MYLLFSIGWMEGGTEGGREKEGRAKVGGGGLDGNEGEHEPREVEVRFKKLGWRVTEGRHL